MRIRDSKGIIVILPLINFVSPASMFRFFVLHIALYTVVNVAIGHVRLNKLSIEEFFW